MDLPVRQHRTHHLDRYYGRLTWWRARSPLLSDRHRRRGCENTPTLQGSTSALSRIDGDTKGETAERSPPAISQNT